MEYIQGSISDNEKEKASNSYLISLVAIVASLPMPIVALVSTCAFYFINKKTSSYFVKWHCTQALISQLLVFVPNTIAFWWTISILFSSTEISNLYLSYLLTIMILNIIEFIATISAAIHTRKGKHIVFWFIGPLTNLLCKPY